MPPQRRRPRSATATPGEGRPKKRARTGRERKRATMEGTRAARRTFLDAVGRLFGPWGNDDGTRLARVDKLLEELAEAAGVDLGPLVTRCACGRDTSVLMQCTACEGTRCRSCTAHNGDTCTGGTTLCLTCAWAAGWRPAPCFGASVHCTTLMPPDAKYVRCGLCWGSSTGSTDWTRRVDFVCTIVEAADKEARRDGGPRGRDAWREFVRAEVVLAPRTMRAEIGEQLAAALDEHSYTWVTSAADADPGVRAARFVWEHMYEPAPPAGESTRMLAIPEWVSDWVLYR